VAIDEPGQGQKLAMRDLAHWILSQMEALDLGARAPRDGAELVLEAFPRGAKAVPNGS
jgi:hypothetical protein